LQPFAVIKQVREFSVAGNGERGKEKIKKTRHHDDIASVHHASKSIAESLYGFELNHYSGFSVEKPKVNNREKGNPSLWKNITENQPIH
jgi:hypothetical protein